MKINHPIAFINYSLSGGGAERNVINLSNYFIAHKQPVDILIFKQINDYEKEYKHAPANGHIIPIFRFKHKIPPLLLPFYFMKLLFHLSHLIKKKKYQLLIAPQEYVPYYVVIFLSKIFRIKNLLIVSNNIEEIVRSKKMIPRLIHMVLFFISFALSDKIVCLSQGLKESIVQAFNINPDKISVIHTGIDQSIIKKVLAKNVRVNRFSNGGPIITAMGRLVPQKGFIHLIRAFSQVVRVFPKSQLFIIGKGPQKQELMRLISKQKLKRNVVLPGFHEPYNLLKQAVVFVFFSHYEGFGNVLIEAMHCGIPVISMDCPYGPKEIIGDSNWGILSPAIDFNDTEDIQSKKEKIFADKIIHLLKNKTLLKKYKILSLLRAKSFTLDIMGKKYLKVIHDMME